MNRLRISIVTSIVLLTYATSSYPCAHNFKGEVAAVGHSQLVNNQAHRVELLTGVPNGAKPLKIFIAPDSSRVSAVILSKTERARLDAIADETSSLPMRGTRSGYSTPTHIQLGKWNIQIEEFHPDTPNTKTLFDTLQTTYSIETSKLIQEQMNQRLSAILGFGYKVIVTSARITTPDSKEDDISIGIQIDTPIAGNSLAAKKNNYLETVLMSKWFEFWITTTGITTFAIEDATARVVRSALTKSQKFHSEFEGRSSPFGDEKESYFLYMGYRVYKVQLSNRAVSSNDLAGIPASDPGIVHINMADTAVFASEKREGTGPALLYFEPNFFGEPEESK